MSWFKRLKDWATEEVLSSDDLNAEFDNIAEALNELFQAGVVNSTGVVSGFAVSTEASIPGSTKAITVNRASLAVVTSVFDIELSTGSSTGTTVMRGRLYLDGAGQPNYAELGLGPGEKSLATVSETYVVALSPGSHTFKQTVQGSNVGAASWNVWHASYSYLIVPDPNP